MLHSTASSAYPPCNSVEFDALGNGAERLNTYGKQRRQQQDWREQQQEPAVHATQLGAHLVLVGAHVQQLAGARLHSRPAHAQAQRAAARHQRIKHGLWVAPGRWGGVSGMRRAWHGEEEDQQ